MDLFAPAKQQKSTQSSPPPKCVLENVEGVWDLPVILCLLQALQAFFIHWDTVNVEELLMPIIYVGDFKAEVGVRGR